MLNAFRHHRNSHRRRSFPRSRAQRRVLNAFRHHRNSHISLARAGISSWGSAQRLSASSEFSRAVCVCVVLRSLSLCSTPFGIIGILTNLLTDMLSDEVGLCSTPFGIIGILTFTQLSQRHGLTRTCSTPFGIIGILTHSPLRSPLSLPIASVLNAFRHHRNSHSKIIPICHSGKLCSTPFGIIGILTQVQRLLRHGQVVLNAFRHHRNSHIPVRC